MDIRKIKKLIELLEESDVEELEILFASPGVVNNWLRHSIWHSIRHQHPSPPHRSRPRQPPTSPQSRQSLPAMR